MVQQIVLVNNPVIDHKHAVTKLAGRLKLVLNVLHDCNYDHRLSILVNHLAIVEMRSFIFLICTYIYIYIYIYIYMMMIMPT